MKNNKFKDSFKSYIKARKENKDCSEPCIKNGQSDRFCFECVSEIIDPLLNDLNTQS